MPLTLQNIESELSYAYLHAVASHAGMNCFVSNRHADNYGVDATIEYFGPIPGTYRTDVSLRVQLKATKNFTKVGTSHISYNFTGIDQYNRLRTNAGEPHRILILLCLPEDHLDWLTCSADQLIMKDAAYWICLYGADATNNTTSKTIQVPLANLLTPSALENLAKSIGQGTLPSYVHVP